MGSEPQFAKYPNLGLAQHIFSLATSPQSAQHTSLIYSQNAIKEHKMAPLYRHLAHPTDGVLNNVGESSSKSPPSAFPPGPHDLKRRGSLVSSNLLPTKKQIQGGLLEWDETLYEELKKNNEEELEGFQKEEDEAQEKAGEVEVQAARGKRAEFWARVGDKVSICRAL
jgi:26S proteasome regulatory subunit N7